MAPDARRTVAVLVACAFLLTAVALPATAEPGEGNGNGNGGGKGKSGDKGGGNGNGGGNSGGNSGAGAGSAGGSNGGSGGDGASSTAGGGNAQSPSNGGGNGEGSDASTSDSGSSPGRSGERGASGQDGQGNGPGAENGPVNAPAQGPPTHAEAQAAAATVDESGDDASGASSGSSSGSSAPWYEFVGFVVDQADATGGFIEAVQSREDFAEILSTDMDAPIVSAAMVLLTAGVMLGLYGAVRMDNGQLAGRLKAAVIRREDASELQAHALAAGLPEDRWTGLDASSYRKLLSLDPHAVAFWMGSDVVAVQRWQAGRTLEQDLAEGVGVPRVETDHTEWSVAKRRRAVVGVAVEAVPVES